MLEHETGSKGENRESAAGVVARAGPLVRRSAFWLVLEKLLTTAVALGASLFVVRYLGPKVFGELSYAQSLVGLFSALGTLGLDAIVVRRIAQKDDSAGELLSVSYVLRFFGGFLGAGAALLTAFLLGGRPETLLLVAVCGGSLLSNVWSVPDLWFRSHIISGIPVLLRSISSILVAIISVALVLRMASVFQLAAVAPLVALPLGFIFFFALRAGMNKSIQWRFSGSVALDLLKESWPLLLSGLSVAVYMRIDQVMLRELTNEREVGLYAAAVRISGVIYFVPVLLGDLALPLLARLRNSAEEKTYQRAIQGFLDAMVLQAYLFILPIVYFAREIVVLLLGTEFTEAAPILRVHAFAFVFVSLGVACSHWLVTEGSTRFSLMSTLLGAFTNILANWYILPRYGGVGAAWTTLFSQATAAYLTLLLTRQTRTIFVKSTKSFFAPLRPKEVAFLVKRLLA